MGHEHHVQAVSADFELGRAISGAADHTLRVWDLEANRRAPHLGLVRSCGLEIKPD